MEIKTKDWSRCEQATCQVIPFRPMRLRRYGVDVSSQYPFTLSTRNSSQKVRQSVLRGYLSSTYTYLIDNDLNTYPKKQ